MATEARTTPRWGHVTAVRQVMGGQPHRISRFGEALWRYKLLILACIALVLGLTAAYVSTLARAYEATALVTLDDRRGQQVGQDSPLQSGLEDQLRLIESRSMAERLVERLDLQLLPEFRPNDASSSRFADLFPDAILDRLPTAWADTLVRRPPDPELTDEQLAARLWEEVIEATMARIRGEVTPPSTLALRFTSGDPQLAAAGANALAELYLEERGALRQNASHSDRARLGQEIERLRASVRETQRAIEAARAGADAQSSATGEQSLLDLTGELAFWRRERAELEARLRQAQTMLQSGAELDRAALAPDSARLGQLQASVIELQHALADLSQRYGEEDPSILELRTQLAALQQEQRAELEQIVQGQQEELAIIQSRETALEARIEALEQPSEEDQVSGDLAILEQRLEAERAALRGYLQQAAARLGSQPSASALPEARVITPAVVPEQPTHPRLALIWGVASAAALLLGILLAFALEALRRGRA